MAVDLALFDELLHVLVKRLLGMHYLAEHAGHLFLPHLIRVHLAAGLVLLDEVFSILQLSQELLRSLLYGVFLVLILNSRFTGSWSRGF